MEHDRLLEIRAGRGSMCPSRNATPLPSAATLLGAGLLLLAACRQPGYPQAADTATAEAASTVEVAAAAPSLAASAEAAPSPAIPTTAEPTRPSNPVAVAALEFTTSTPDGAVRGFYRLLGRGDYEGMDRLLSAHMRDIRPADPAVLRDRTPPGFLMVQRAEVVEMDEAGTHATVAVDVVEQLGSSGGSRHYVGTWKLVRGPAGWLLDEPNIHVE